MLDGEVDEAFVVDDQAEAALERSAGKLGSGGTRTFGAWGRAVRGRS